MDYSYLRSLWAGFGWSIDLKPSRKLSIQLENRPKIWPIIFISKDLTNCSVGPIAFFPAADPSF